MQDISLICKKKMPRINFKYSNGESVIVDAEVGSCVMVAAISAGVSGILAECGGALSCATCHVYVDLEWIGRLPEMSADEDAMLDSTYSERRPTSRLSCQIEVTDEIDELSVEVPEAQA
jgi:ferredoxin, 2Fe-2S